MAVGMRLVRQKSKALRKLERRPQELVDFILENPIRVVLGAQQQAFVIDHHHLGLALREQKFETAPVVVEADFSQMGAAAFWAEMERRHWLRAVDHKGRACSIDDIPHELEELKDDPYRSLAGFLRYAGGFAKTSLPYAEFQWADYLRALIAPALLRENFDKAVRRAMKLAHLPAAQALPGYRPEAVGGGGPLTADGDD